MLQVNKAFIRFGAILISLIQIFSLVGLFILNSLVRKKVGVNHHVLIRKKEYLDSFLSPDMIEIYKFAIIVIIVLAIIYFLFCTIRKRGALRIINSIVIAIISILIYLELVVEKIISLPIYVYLLLITVVVLILEVIKAFLLVKYDGKK